MTKINSEQQMMIDLDVISNTMLDHLAGQEKAKIDNERETQEKLLASIKKEVVKVVNVRARLVVVPPKFKTLF